MGRIVLLNRRAKTRHRVGLVGTGNLGQFELDDAEVALGNLWPATADGGQKYKKDEAESHNSVSRFKTGRR